MRKSKLEAAAAGVGLAVEKIGALYWVSGLEKWRSETWVRNEVRRRS